MAIALDLALTTDCTAVEFHREMQASERAGTEIGFAPFRFLVEVSAVEKKQRLVKNDERDAKDLLTC